MWESQREKLLTECNLHTIVRLPNGVFAPYTGIKTNLLFFTKGEPTQDIWYYEHPYPAGVKSYNKTKPIRIEEFNTEKAWWYGETPKKKGKGKAREGEAPAEPSYANRTANEHAWKVPLSQIQASGDNLDIKNPHDSSVAHADPDELLASYQQLLVQVQQTRDQLKNELAKALTSHGGTSMNRPPASAFSLSHSNPRPQ